MNFSDYQQTFERILSGELTSAPYDDPHFIEYVKLNDSRQNRWVKKGVLLDEAVDAINNIQSKQTWVLITEPWCGDASHTVPFIVKLAELNNSLNFFFFFFIFQNHHIVKKIRSKII
jgi:hypothetical protein